MGGGEADASAKTPKASAAQEQPPVTASTPAAAVYSDWSFQAYPPMPPHGFFPSPVASSPQPHPYMWGAQHIMPPYGTPPYVMYPPGGLYPHPSMPPGSHPFSPYSMTISNGNAESSGAVPGGGEADGKSSEGKDRSPLKRSKGSLGSLNMITGKNNHSGQGKPSGQPPNGAFSQSGESGSDSSSEGSDANSQNDSQHKTSGGNESYDETSKSGNTARASQNGTSHTPAPPVLGQTMSIMPMPAAVAPGAVAGPTTNLNIGMDYWGAPSSSSIPGIRGKIPATAVGGAVVSGASSDLWLQDEREIKRQRRKQSNRESARRSRLRKQAECEELAQRADVLKEENATLRTELNRIKSEYEQLLSQNNLLKEKLGETHQGTGNSSVDRSEHYSGDNTKMFLDNHAKPAEGDATTD